MKYDNETALVRIYKRSGELKRRAKNRVTGILTSVIAALLVAEAAVWNMIIVPGDAAPAGSTYGAFMLMGESGIYVLIGVVAFALGVVITLICIRSRRRYQSGKPLLWDTIPESERKDD